MCPGLTPPTNTQSFGGQMGTLILQMSLYNHRVKAQGSQLCAQPDPQHLALTVCLFFKYI